MRRGSNSHDRHGPRGSGDRRRGMMPEPEDDPFRDLRPGTEEPEEPSGEEYVWPDMTDEDEEDY